MSLVDMKVPVIGESVSEVTLSQWLKGNGEYVALDEPICEFESDKATLEFPAEAAGKLIWVAAKGDDLPIGAVVAQIDTSVSKSEVPAVASPVAVPVESKTTQEIPKDNYVQGHPSPAAAKLMAEKNITSSEVTGTGRDGRITKEDVTRKMQESPSQEKSATPHIEPPVERDSVLRMERRVKLSRMRRTIAARLVSAKNSTAMLTTFNEVDMTGIMELRKKYQDAFVAKFGIKLGFMSIFAKACAQVLLEMPEINAYLDGDDLVYHDYVDISIAISTPTGLVVPPVRHVEKLGYHEIEMKIKELADKAREGKLTLEEMRGGTFTITNGGIFGSLVSTPILNEPQSAILGMHAIQDRPIALNGQVVIRPMMYLALSYDHRVIDGSSSVTFLVKVKQLLEDPVKLLMGL